MCVNLAIGNKGVPCCRMRSDERQGLLTVSFYPDNIQPLFVQYILSHIPLHIPIMFSNFVHGIEPSASLPSKININQQFLREAG